VAIFSLDPDQTIANNFSLVGSSSLDLCVGKTTRDPAIPSLTTRVESVALGSFSGVVGLETFAKLSPITVVDVTAHMYFTPPSNGSITLTIMVDGVDKASAVSSSIADGWGDFNWGDGVAWGVPPAGTTGWLTANWVSGDITQDQINKLQLKVDATTSSGTAVIYQLYADVQANIVAMTFNPAVNSYTPATPKAWRPRIKPGAFWV